MTQLTWQSQTDGLHFQCIDGKTAIPVGSWPASNPLLPSTHRQALLGPLLIFVESGLAEDQGDRLIVKHSAVAQLTREQLSGLGLPGPMPFSLNIEGTGLITDAHFFFSYYYIHPTGKPVMGPERDGCLISSGERQYIISEPLFTLIDSLDRFNQAPPEDRATRMENIALIQEIIPTSVNVTESFKNLRVIRADRLSLRPFVNTSGEADFDPVPFRRIPRQEEELESPDATQPALPDAIQDSYARNFRKINSVTRTASAGSGWYLVMSETLREVFQVAKDYQRKPQHERKLFLLNPRAYIHQALIEKVDDETIESLFEETDQYSKRVKEVGIWQPRVLPFVTRSTKGWLPPAEFGLQIGEHSLSLDHASLQNLSNEVKTALENDQTSISFGDTAVPVTQDTVEALDTLQKLSRTRSDEIPEEMTRFKTALIIHDNFEAVEYSSDVRPGHGSIGTHPTHLKTNLLPHQVEGYRWLQELWVAGTRGGLLADDMGLGKTLQALSFLCWIKEQNQQSESDVGPILIVAPTGLLRNWLAEHERHFGSPGLGYFLEAHGNNIGKLHLSTAKKGNEFSGGLPVLDVDKIRNMDWVLTTYETLRDYQHSFGRIRWSVVVFDEAQKIKNPATLMTDAAKAMNADMVVVLTGTPVENTLADLWCIVDTIRPGFLGSLKDFSVRYEKNSQDSIALAELKASLSEKGNPPLLKRRMKEDHLKGLPAIHYYAERLEMPPVQAEVYRRAVEQAKASEGKGKMFQTLHALRSISLHPGRSEDSNDGEYISSSARMKYMFDVLDRVADKQQKALIFLDSLNTQGDLAEIIQRRFSLAAPPLIINGQIQGPKRMERVELFQNRKGFDVMLLSPKAGGVGITLTAANHVIHLARWWNPAVEDQCTDRVYRIGQTRDVHVYLPLAIHPQFGAHSFDQRLDELLSEKRALSRTLLAPPTLSDKDFSEMYNDVINKTG